MSNQMNEIQSCANLLREIGDMCEHATLTDGLRGGEARVVHRYNAALSRLNELEAVPSGFFAPLPETAKYGEIGVEARMLSSYVKDKRKNKGGGDDPSVLMRLAPFVDEKDLGLIVRDQIKRGQTLDMDQLTQLAPFLDSEILGTLIRQNMASDPEPASNSSEETPVPATPASSPSTEVKPNMDELLERLKYPYLSVEQRDDLLNQIREVGKSEGKA